MEELVAKTELEREAARLERELQDLEALLAKERERLSALSPLPVYWRRVRCGKACGGCPHGPYPYLLDRFSGEPFPGVGGLAFYRKGASEEAIDALEEAFLDIEDALDVGVAVILVPGEREA